MGITVTRAAIAYRQLDAAVRYDIDGGSWDQAFSADLLDEAAIRARLAAAGLAFERWLDEPSGWLAARPLGVVTLTA